jgi:hypothetical protein
MLAFFWLDNQFEVIFSPCDSLVLRLFNDVFSAATVRPTLHRIRLEDGLEWRLVMVPEGGVGVYVSVVIRAVVYRNRRKSGQPVTWPSFEPGTFRKQVYSGNHYTKPFRSCAL